MNSNNKIEILNNIFFIESVIRTSIKKQNNGNSLFSREEVIFDCKRSGETRKYLSENLCHRVDIICKTDMNTSGDLVKYKKLINECFEYAYINFGNPGAFENIWWMTSESISDEDESDLYSSSTISIFIRFHFKNEEDAVLFKLRFGNY